MGVHYGKTAEEKAGILARTNFSEQWLEHATDVCRQMDCDVIMRSSKALDVSSVIPGHGKTTGYKAKTVKTGLAAGTIPDRAVYKEIYDVKLRAGDLPKDPETRQFQMTLADLIRGANAAPPQFKLQLKENILYIEVLQKGHARDVHTINLTQGHAYPGMATTIDPKMKQPDWLTPEIQNKINFAFPVTFGLRTSLSQPVESVPQKPLMCHSIGDDIIKFDYDGLAMVSAVKRKPETLFSPPPPLPESATKIFNTFISGEREQMLAALIALHRYVCDKEKIPFDLNDIPDAAVVGKWGRMTAIEAYFTHMVNMLMVPEKEHAHRKGKHQHGFENQNPGKPSDIDAPMLFVLRNGDVVYTETEKDIVKFLMTDPNYLKDNHFDVHPGWDMRIWHPVVARQLEYGQPVSAETKFSFLTYLAGENLLRHYQSEFKVTSEAALIAKLHQDPNILKTQAFRVQPGWDMEKWAPVIEKQLELKHTVEADTLLQFYQYRFNVKNEADLVTKIADNPANAAKIQIHPDWNAARWAPVIAQQLDGGQKIHPTVLRNFASYLESIREDLKNTSYTTNACKKKHELLDKDEFTDKKAFETYVDRLAKRAENQLMKMYAGKRGSMVGQASAAERILPDPHPALQMKLMMGVDTDFTSRESVAELKKLAERAGWLYNEKSNMLVIKDKDEVVIIRLQQGELTANISNEMTRKAMAQITHALGVKPVQLDIVDHHKMTRSDLTALHLEITGPRRQSAPPR